jgi:hypothetical protein
VYLISVASEVPPPTSQRRRAAGARNEVLQEVREYFEKNPGPLEQMREVVVTR